MSSPLSLPDSVAGVEAKLLYDMDALIGVTATLLALSTIAVALRVYVRAGLIHQFGWDDAVMVAAWLFWVMTATICFIATGAEKTLVVDGVLTYPMETLVELIRYSNAAYSLTMITTKISIGLFFLKIFTSGFKWQRILIYTLVAISSIFGAVYLIMTFATCGIMVRSQATTPMHTGSDWCPIQDKFVDMSIVWSVTNAITDVTFQALSIQVLWNLKLGRAAKLSASLLLILGSIGGVASIARIFVQTPLDDIRLEGLLLGLWSNVEAGLCITAASLITLRPLFQSCLERTKSTLASISGRSSGSKGTPSGSTEEIDLEKGERKCSACSNCAVKVTRTFGISKNVRELEVKEKELDTLSSTSSNSYE